MQGAGSHLSLLLADLSGKLIPDSSKDMEDVLANCRKRISRKVDEKEYAAAEFLFNEESSAVLLKQDELLQARRQPRKRKAPNQGGQRPSKRPRLDAKKSHHQRKRQKPKHSKRQ